MLVASEDVMVTVTKEGYVKRTSLRSYSASNGEDFAMKESDRILFQQEMNTTEVLLLFTNKGNYIYRPVHKLPDIRWKDVGEHISNMVPLERNEEIVKAIPVEQFSDQVNILFMTKKGIVKKSLLAKYKAVRYNRPLIAINVKEGDELIDVHLSAGGEEIFLCTHLGYGLRFSEKEVKTVGVRAAGMKGIDLKDGDIVVSGKLFVEKNAEAILIATQRGAIKKMKMAELDKGTRARRGSVMLRELKKNPHRIVDVELVHDSDTVFLSTEKQMVKPIDVANVRFHERYSNGSYMIDEKESGHVREIWKEPVKNTNRKKKDEI